MVAGTWAIKLADVETREAVPMNMRDFVFLDDALLAAAYNQVDIGIVNKQVPRDVATVTLENRHTIGPFRAFILSLLPAIEGNEVIRLLRSFNSYGGGTWA